MVEPWAGMMSPEFGRRSAIFVLFFDFQSILRFILGFLYSLEHKLKWETDLNILNAALSLGLVPALSPP